MDTDSRPLLYRLVRRLNMIHAVWDTDEYAMYSSSAVMHDSTAARMSKVWAGIVANACATTHAAADRSSLSCNEQSRRGSTMVEVKTTVNTPNHKVFQAIRPYLLSPSKHLLR